VAQGKVRCGVCNTVFQAAPAPVAAKPAAPTASTKPSKSQFINDDDDFLLSDELNDAAPAPVKKAAKTSFAQMDEDLIQDSPDDKEDESSLNLDAFIIDDEGDNFGSKSSTKIAGEDEEDADWINELLEAEGIDADKIKKEPEKAAPVNNGPRKALGSSADDFDFDLDGLDGAPLTLSPDEAAAFGYGEEEATKDEMIRNIKTEPLVLQLLHHRTLMSTIGLTVSGSVALLVLLLQLFLFQKDTLSRTPGWHGIYQSVCAIGGCTLPKQYAIEDIQATNLTVKSHPHYLQALMIDAIIVNHADIMQPFPKIQLFFTDNNQTVVAAREFTPKEYLRGELADASLMPNQQSIHIALEVDDPGQSASGYFLKLRY
jgi:hypothetical protein